MKHKLALVTLVIAAAPVFFVGVVRGAGKPMAAHHSDHDDGPRCPALGPNEDAVLRTMTQVFYCRSTHKRVDFSWEFVGSKRWLYVPKEERWKREMPPWSVEHRAEIISRLLYLSEQKGVKFVVHEY
jgi:hypothetical protein